MGKRKRITPKPRKSALPSKNIRKVDKPKNSLSLPPALMEGTEYTGATITRLLDGEPLIKFTNEEEKHNGFQFVTGENRDTVEFRPYNFCTKGGLYFCKKSDADRWMFYNCRLMHYFRRVTLPDDARVYVEDNKMKADKFILGERETISTSRELFDQVLQNMGQHFIANVVFQFDRSFYDEHAWTTILKSPFAKDYNIPVALKTDVFRNTVLNMLGKDSISLFVAIDALGIHNVCGTDDVAILEKLILHGLTFDRIPYEYENRQVLRCFLRMGKLEQAGYFPQRLFLDETLLEGIRTTRALEQLVAEKKQYARN